MDQRTWERARSWQQRNNAGGAARAFRRQPAGDDDDEEPYDEVFDKGLPLGSSSGSQQRRRRGDHYEEDGGIPDANVEVPAAAGGADGVGAAGAGEPGAGKPPRVTPWKDKAKALVQKARSCRCSRSSS